MNMKLNRSGGSRNGGISIALLLIAFALSVSVASYLRLSTHNLRLNYRAVSFQRARVLAESALDASAAKFEILVENKELGLSSENLQDLLDEAVEGISPVFTEKEQDYEVKILAMQLQHPSGFVTKIEDGKLIEYQEVRIVSGVSNRVDGVHAAFSKLVRITREPFLRYAIFFDGLLELHPGPAMVVNGDMRSNSQIELWAGNSLDITGQILCPGQLTIHKSDEDDDYSTENACKEAAKKIKVKVDEVFKSFFQDNATLDSMHENWTQLSREVWNGQVLAGSEIVELNPPIENGIDNHALIEPIDDSDTPKLKKEKIAHKADLYITVSESGEVEVARAGGKSDVESSAFAEPSGKSNNGMYTVANGWINVHDNYYDPRESEDAYNYGNGSVQRMQMVDIYMDKLLETYPGTSIVYVEVKDPQSANLKPAVRIRNGANIGEQTSGGGLSIASHRTMYVEGDFNTGNKVPSLIAADNLTLLSNGWDDGNAASAKPDTGVNTTLNAALMIGYADPENLAGGSGSTATGGAHNLLRFRENWGGRRYDFSGSYISLWSAQDSHCLYDGKYYSPPSRNITYDSSFLTESPPGMPVGYTTPETVCWEEIDWQTALDFLEGE